MIVLRNQGRRTFEIVSSVDGRRAVGRPGSYTNGGYVLYPGRTLTIEGFRKSRDEVARSASRRCPTAMSRIRSMAMPRTSA